jgi:clan AA aspartic protease
MEYTPTTTGYNRSNPMDLTHVTVNVSNLQKNQPPFEAEFLVDTGAIDCLAPASALRAAGIGIEGQDVYELANGEVLEYPYGFARISFMGSETVAQIIFGPEDCEPILGVVALENTGIGIDPVSRGLKRMAAKPLK